MRTRLRIAGIAAAVAATLPGASAQADAPHPTLQGIRPLGMGDAFVAVVNDRNALYYNPAGLSNLRRTRISGLGLQAGVDDELLDVIHFIQKNEDAFSDFQNVDPAFLDELAPFDDKWVSADASAYVDMTRPGFGIGVYSVGRAQFRVDRGVYEPRVFANVIDDIVLTGGGSMDLGRGDLRAGAALKTIWRRQFNRALTAREVSNFEPDIVAERLSGADAGFSMDLGALWSPPGSSFAAGAVLRDAAGTVAGESIGAAFDLGGSWRPLAGRGGGPADVVLAADLRDVFGSSTAFGSRINLGAEVQVPIVAFRAGFHQGYPSLGLSLGFPVLSLDYAFYGRELGDLPGADRQYMHVLEARLGF